MVVWLVPDGVPPNLGDPDRYRKWKPDAQQKALSLLREAENNRWRPFYCPDTHCNGQPHVLAHDLKKRCTSKIGHHIWEKDSTWVCSECGIGGNPIPDDQWLFPHARPDQRPPKWTPEWLTLLLRSGRGSGKTRTGSEITNRVTQKVGRLILIAATGPDLRDTMVEGESGILATSPPGKRPLWEPSKKRLTWPNGAIAQGFSAEEPDRLRGPQSGFVWADEPAHWALVEEVWENMLYGLRLGKDPKIVATSTPKPTKWMKALVAKPDTIDRVVSTYANIGNLAATYKRNIIEPREGTRMGQQELFGQILEDVEGAMWNWDIIHTVEDAPPLRRVVVSIDPAGTANKRSDETGIIVVGISHDNVLYVLADYTGKMSPEQWGRKAWQAVADHEADAIVFEKNYGGDMVKTVLTSTAPDGAKVILPARLIPVTSRRGKDIRAEPIVALYEKVKVYHVGQRGDLEKLEDEMTTWVPHESASPNRVDALVHGATELGKNVMPAAVASPLDLFRRRGA